MTPLRFYSSHVCVQIWVFSTTWHVEIPRETQFTFYKNNRVEQKACNTFRLISQIEIFLGDESPPPRSFQLSFQRSRWQRPRSRSAAVWGRRAFSQSQKGLGSAPAPQLHAR